MKNKKIVKNKKALKVTIPLDTRISAPGKDFDIHAIDKRLKPLITSFNVKYEDKNVDVEIIFDKNYSMGGKKLKEKMSRYTLEQTFLIYIFIRWILEGKFHRERLLIIGSNRFIDILR